MKAITFVLCAFFLLNADIQAQDMGTDTIQKLFLEQISLYPQEKIHVQTDKPSYISGDTIWLRAHLVDALLLKQANASRYVYVELINPLAEVVDRVMLRSDSLGCFYGYVSLDEALPEGNYTLRAYTRFMQNQGEDYFFRKSVYVIDPASAGISPKVDFTFGENKIFADIYFTGANGEGLIVPDNCSLFPEGNPKGEEIKLSFEEKTAHYSFNMIKSKNQPVFLLQSTYKGKRHSRFFTVPQPDDTFDVSFFPEGGHAPLQSDIQIAFKALKKNGLHENVKGIVYDDTGKEWARFESRHLGMGQFRMHYLPGRTYYAVCTNENNRSQRFSLPLPEPNTVALKAHWSGGSLRLTLSMSPDYALPPGVHLVAHIRGTVLYSQPWAEARGYLFEKDFFPAGIIHFLLVDKERNILSERLVFSLQSSSFAKVCVTHDKQTYETRDKIGLDIKVTDEYEVPLAGNFSLSVVDMRDVSPDTSSGIISTLLLTSELKGYIESPMSYFQNDDPKTIAALDVLMMTQGWRRYNVPEILKGNLLTEPKYLVESNRQFSGKVTGVFSALREGNISLIAHKDSILGTSFVKTEEDGRFVFSNVDYPDSTRYLIQALRKKGSSLAFIELDPVESFPRVTLPPLPAPEKHNYNNSYLDKATEKQAIENGMWLINLAEVEVTAKRIHRRKTESPYYSISSSHVVATEEIEKANFLTVFDLLRRLPGITISGNEVYYRRATPMLILDNVPMENFDYSMLNVNDISDAFVSPATSVMPIFGSRAANGAIVINTKKGFVEKNSMNKNMQVFTPIGYQQHVEFYSPAYETEGRQIKGNPDLRSTIYWNPSVWTDNTGIAHLSFYSADFPSQYGIVLEGISSFGHLIYSSSEAVEVK